MSDWIKKKIIKKKKIPMSNILVNEYRSTGQVHFPSEL